MNHRERVLTTLRHEEPDTVPLDLGGTVDSTISALVYQGLRRMLGLPPSVTWVSEICQMMALIEEDVRQALDIDSAPVVYEPREWRKGSLQDGSPANFPSRFNSEFQDDGSQIVSNDQGIVVLKMPEGGHYFDSVYCPLADATNRKDIERYFEAIENYDRPAYLDKSFEELAEKARELLQNTDYFLVGFFGGHIFQSSQSLRGWDKFLEDLVMNTSFAEALMDRMAEAGMRRFEHYARTLGQYVHLIHFEDDLGMQDRPLLSPSMYRRLVKPYQKKLFSYVKSRTKASILLHTDGAVAPFIPDFIEMGIDVLNPVQVSALGMDTKELKKEFGSDISFWGAGCDSQSILPLGTAREVADEVKRRLNDLAPGGGYVFSPIHNIQKDVPPENVVVMFKTAREFGIY